MARNKIEHDGKTYMAVPVEHSERNRFGCAVCDLAGSGICDAAWCSGYERSDETDIVFKERRTEI